MGRDAVVEDGLDSFGVAFDDRVVEIRIRNVKSLVVDATTRSPSSPMTVTAPMISPPGQPPPCLPAMGAILA